jgi:hypothetical protein
MSDELSATLATTAGTMWRGVVDDVTLAVRSPAFWRLPAQLVSAGAPPSKAWLQRHQQRLALWVVLAVVVAYVLRLLGALARKALSR